MARSKVVIYLHFVWATHQRLPLITPEIEEQVYAVILSEAKKCGLTILAIGGMPDHVHLAVRKPATITESQIMQRIKGVSSAVTRESIVAPGEIFRWQEHYAVFSFQASMKGDVIKYIENQKENHAARKLMPSLEDTGEEGD